MRLWCDCGGDAGGFSSLCEANLLAGRTILLASDDGKVAADGPEAGEDLEERDHGGFSGEGVARTWFHCNAGEKLIIKVQMFWSTSS